jgi:hypothetical protein
LQRRKGMFLIEILSRNNIKNTICDWTVLDDSFKVRKIRPFLGFGALY